MPVTGRDVFMIVASVSPEVSGLGRTIALADTCNVGELIAPPVFTYQ